MSGDWDRPDKWHQPDKWERPGMGEAPRPDGEFDSPHEAPRQRGGSRTSGGMIFRMGGNPAGRKFGAAVALILVGTAFFLNNLGILHVENSWEYWPLLLVLAGARQLYTARSEGAYVRGFIEIVTGVLFQLHNSGLLHVSIGALWPVALIGVGILLLFRPGFMQFAPSKPGAIRNEVQEFSFFGGVKRVLTTREFQGGELLSLFGGIELDMRGADIAPGVQEVHVEANCAFGGIVIKVPARWNVEVRGMGIFGGYEDKTLPVQAGLSATAPVLIIRGFAAFGGVTVE